MAWPSTGSGHIQHSGGFPHLLRHVHDCYTRCSCDHVQGNQSFSPFQRRACQCIICVSAASRCGNFSLELCFLYFPASFAPRLQSHMFWVNGIAFLCLPPRSLVTAGMGHPNERADDLSSLRVRDHSVRDVPPPRHKGPYRRPRHANDSYVTFQSYIENHIMLTCAI